MLNNVGECFRRLWYQENFLGSYDETEVIWFALSIWGYNTLSKYGKKLLGKAVSSHDPKKFSWYQSLLKHSPTLLSMLSL